VVCGVHNINQGLDQQLTRAEKLEDEGEEAAENKVTSLDPLKRQKVGWKYICQFDT
jgi:hypothetical protein